MLAVKLVLGYGMKGVISSESGAETGMCDVAMAVQFVY